MTPKQCRNAGHRWGRPHVWDNRAYGIHVELAACQRRGCDRLRACDDTGHAETYRLVDGHVVDRVVVRRATVAA